MSSWDDSQWLIANEVLKLLFEGEITLTRQGANAFTVRGVSGVWRLDALDRSFSYLDQRTGPKKEIDPFERADSTSWIILSQLLSALGLKQIALEVALRYLKKCYGLQLEYKRRIHKGAPLFWVSERYRETGDNDNARGYMLLATVEDSGGDPVRAPAYQRLLTIFGFSDSFLNGLIEYARKHSPFDFPEEILLGWELATSPTLSKSRRGD